MIDPNGLEQAMGELHRALGDIQSIRRQVADATEFRGYGPVAVAMTGLFAVVGGAVQAWLVPQPLSQPGGYLALWVAVAVLSTAVAGVTMWTRSRRLHSGLSGAMLTMAVQQFAPALVTGSLLTLVLPRVASGLVWLLPGLWMLLASLGVFASCRFLPRGIAAGGAWYLLLGLLAVGLGDARALSPWVMALAFGAGQMWIAAVLWSAGKAAEIAADGEESDGWEEA